MYNNDVVAPAVAEPSIRGRCATEDNASVLVSYQITNMVASPTVTLPRVPHQNFFLSYQKEINSENV